MIKIITSKETKWRLPTVSELVAIFDYEKGKPKIDGFSSNTYWSSSNLEGYPSNVWGVYFRSGNVNYGSKDGSYYVRCVRDTDEGLIWSKSSEESMSWNEAVEYAKNLKE